MRAIVLRETFTTQDGSRLTAVRVNTGIATVSTLKDYEPGQSIEIEPEGNRWRAVETRPEAA